MKKEYMDELREMAGYDEDGNEIDDVAEDEANTISNDSANEDNQEKPFDTEGSMECKILLQEKDMRHFMFHHTYTSFSGWFGVLISLAALAMVIIGRGRYGMIETVVLIILALLFTVVQPLQILSRARRQIKMQDMFHDTLIYNLCDKGLLIRQGEQFVNVSWNEIRKVVRTKKATFIYTSPVRAFIFPLDQIDDAGEFNSLVLKKCGR